MTPDATTAGHPDLINALHEILASCRRLTARHQEILDQYRDADGYVLPAHQADYNDARTDTAIEASDHLDAPAGHLARTLSAQPPTTTFTVTLARPERHDGERPTSFVVHATDLDDARHAAYLPARQQPPGLLCPAQYIDLRPEQAALAPLDDPRRREAPASTRPPAPSSPRPRR